MAGAGPELFLLTCWAVRRAKMLTFKISRNMTTHMIKQGHPHARSTGNLICSLMG
jgi:hypothetical protein